MDRLRIISWGFGLTALLCFIMLLITASLLSANRDLRLDVQRLDAEIWRNRDTIDNAKNWGIYVGTKLDSLGIEAPPYPGSDESKGDPP